MKRAFAVALFLLALTSFADDTRKWGNSPEAYFMTREERREWELIKSDDAAKRFIAAFHARRDPGFAAQISRRAELVDERLALGEAKASTTTRGRIVMLLGAPTEVLTKYIPKTIGGTVGHPLETRKGGSTDGPPKPSLVGAGWMEYTFRYPEWKVVIEADVSSGKDRLKNSRDRKKMEEMLDSAARAMLRRE